MNDKDIEILKLLAEGLTAKEIAGKVFLSVDSVRKRIFKMRENLDCKNTVQLIAKANPEHIRKESI